MSDRDKLIAIRSALVNYSNSARAIVDQGAPADFALTGLLANLDNLVLAMGAALGGYISEEDHIAQEMAEDPVFAALMRQKAEQQEGGPQ